MKLEIESNAGEHPLYISLRKDGNDVVVSVGTKSLLRIKGGYGEIWLYRNGDFWKNLGFKIQENGAVSVDYY